MDKRETVLFFKKLAIFLMISLAFFLIINFIYIRFIISKTHLYGAEKNYYDYLDSLSEKRIKYIIFGDSHVNEADPHYINDSYNSNSGGENYIKTYYKLNKILNKDEVKLDFMLIQIDPNSFSNYTNGDSFFLTDSLWYYYKIMPLNVIANITKKSKIALIIEFYFPVIGHGQHFSYLIREDREDLYRGWQKVLSGNFSKMNKTEVAVMEYLRFMGGDNNRIDPLLIEYFQKILNLSNEKNITIVFVKYPMVKEYIDTLDKYDAISSEEYYKEIFNLINSSNSKYYILDYQDLFFNNSDYFADTQHLADSGSEIFSKQLAADLKKLS